MRLISASIMAALASSPVLAADLGVDSLNAPAPEATAYAFSWTGPEFGLLGGADRLFADGSKFADLEQRFPGGRLGAFAGYQYQFDNNAVFGIEGDASYTWNERDDFILVPANIPEKIRTDWSGSVRARVGYAFDRVLIFATGGWTGTRMVDNVEGFPAERDFFQGYTIGAGMDFAVTDNIFMRAEYRYNDFSEKEILPTWGVDLHQHIVNFGIGAKF